MQDRWGLSATALLVLFLATAQATQAREDINQVTLVMKGGRIYDPARIEQALGIAPRATLTFTAGSCQRLYEIPAHDGSCNRS